MSNSPSSSLSVKALQLGRRVRERRDAADLTAGQLAAYASDPAPDGLKITKSWISRLERGEIEGPSVQRLERIAKVLSCTVGELTGSALDPDLDLEDPELDLMFYNAKRELTPEEKRSLKGQIRLALQIHRERYPPEAAEP